MKKGVAVFLSLLVAGAVGGGSFYQFVYRGRKAAGTGRVSSQSEDAVYVDSVKMLAGLGSGSGVLARYAGVVEPQQTWSAKLEGEKTVKETFVKEGDAVKVGDKLFSYDTTEDEDKLAKDEIDQERSQNEINTSKQRIEQLEKEKAKATNDEQLSYTTSILTEENNIKQEEYDMKVRELEIQSLKEGIEHSDVLSELEGVVQTVARLTESSNGGSSLADSSSEAYITVMEVGDYRVKGTVNEQNISDIYQDMPVIAFSRVDGQYWPGRISEIRTDNGQTNQSDSMYDMSSAGDGSGTNSTNYSFYVTLDNSDGLLLGQHVYLEADEGQTRKRDGIWLPGYYFTEMESDPAAASWAGIREAAETEYLPDDAEAELSADTAFSQGAGLQEAVLQAAENADNESITEADTAEDGFEEEDGFDDAGSGEDMESGEYQDVSTAARLDSACWVWAASDKDLLEKREVTLGDYDETLDLYQVVSGLNAEDYITVPNEFLEEGLPVIYMDETQAIVGENVFPAGEDVFDGSWDAWDDGSWDDGSWDDGSWEDEDWDEEEEDWEDESEDWEEWVSWEDWTEVWTESTEGE